MLLCIPGKWTKPAAGKLLNLPRRPTPAMEVPSLDRALDPHVDRERLAAATGKQQDAIGDLFTHAGEGTQCSTRPGM